MPPLRRGSAIHILPMQHFIELTLQLREAEEWQADLLTQALADLGFESFQREEGSYTLRAYIQEKLYDADAIQSKLQEESLAQCISSMEAEQIETEDWNKEWEKHYYQPTIIVEGEVGVRASFHPPFEHIRHELIIDPKMAFGTGNHATTKGMMQLMQHLYWEGAEVIDMGCGSGILGIYAMKLGAKLCHSIDIDEWSVANSQENARINGVQLNVIHGDASALKKIPRADVLLANINRNIILQDLEAYVGRVKPSGLLILSGFYSDDLALLLPALANYNLTMDGFVENDDWVALKAFPHLP